MHCQEKLFFGFLPQQILQFFPVSPRYPGLSVVIIKVDYLPEFLRIGKPVIQLDAVCFGECALRFICGQDIQAKADRPCIFFQKLPEEKVEIPDRIIKQVFSKLMTVKPSGVYRIL